MFDFLKPKTKLRPEDLGITLATVMVSLWLERISKDTEEYGKQVSNITQSELNDLWQLFLMLHCTVISVGVESSNIEDTNTRIILDAFWNSVPDLLRENCLDNELPAFQVNISRWYKILRELVVEPTAAFSSPGSLGPGKSLLKLAMPNREIHENVKLIIELTHYFVSTTVALSEFAIKSVKKTKLLPSLISYKDSVKSNVPLDLTSGPAHADHSFSHAFFQVDKNGYDCPVTIMVSKAEILSKDVSRVRRIIDSFVPTLIERNRNRVIIMVNGYEEDTRELFLINEVRTWFRQFFDIVPELFFWMDMRPPWLMFYAIMFGTPVRERGETTVSSQDLQHFLIRGYQNINAFCSSKSLSPDLSNEHISDAVNKKTNA